jgi:hypothetical protein
MLSTRYEYENTSKIKTDLVNLQSYSGGRRSEFEHAPASI